MGKDIKGKELGTGLSQLKDGRYCARYTDYYGKRRAIYRRSVKEIKEALNKAIYENKLYHGQISAEKLTLNELYAMWYDWKQYEIKESTLHNYDLKYNKHFRNTIGDTYLATIQQNDIQRLINSLDLSAASKKDIRVILHNIFQYAVVNELILKNPCLNVKIRKSDICVEDEPKFLTKEQVDRLFMYAQKKKHKHLNIYKLMLLTGIRIGEATALLWSDVSFEKRYINISKTEAVYKKNGHYTAIYNQSPKTKCSKRRIPLCDDAIKVLKEQSRSRYTSDTYIFVSIYDTPVSKNIVATCLRGLVSDMKKTLQIDFPKVHPHMFRHTFATNCFDRGIPPKVIQQLLGHASLKMTMDLYTHVTDSSMAEWINRVSL